MDLCSHHHDEICFDGGSCPLCSAIEEHDTKVDELESTIKDLERDVENLQHDDRETNSVLKAKVEELQAECERLYRGQADSER